MFEELEIIKSIVTELSGAGLGFGLAYVAYLFVSKTLLLFGVVWTINEISKRVVDVIKADITKEEAKELKNRIESAELEARKAKEYADSLKHKYKTMMETKNGSNE